MIWKKQFETGVENIDRQNKELFKTFDLLLASDDSLSMQEALLSIQKYLGTHFEWEQAWHKRYEYQDAALHRLYHSDFMRSFEKLADRYVRFGPSEITAFAIYKYATDWLKNHIVVLDKEFARHYNALLAGEALLALQRTD